MRVWRGDQNLLEYLRREASVCQYHQLWWGQKSVNHRKIEGERKEYALRLGGFITSPNVYFETKAGKVTVYQQKVL